MNACSLRTLAVISFVVTILAYSSVSTFYVFGAPNVAPSNADCGVELSWDGPSYVFVQTCCWTETDPGDPEGIELYYCQMCDYNPETKTATGCGEKHPGGPPLPPSDTVAPQQDDALEQPPKTNNPPIKSDNSVSPNDDNSAIDEQQSNPSSPLTDQRVPPGNVGVLEQLEDSSNNQNGESEDSVSSDNPGLLNVIPQNPPS